MFCEEEIAVALKITRAQLKPNPTADNKQLLDEVFVISEIIKVEVKVSVICRAGKGRGR